MAQLQKYNHRMTRDQVPCGICSQDSHPTWKHGKDEWEIYRQVRSRKLNPRDPMFEPELHRLVHPNPQIASQLQPITAAIDNSTAQD